MAASALNALCKRIGGEITLRSYITGIVVHIEDDGSKRDEYTSQWRCLNGDGDVIGRGQTPEEAVRSAYKKSLP